MRFTENNTPPLGGRVRRFLAGFVLLNWAKNFCDSSKILRFAQNDRFCHAFLPTPSRVFS